MGAKRENANIWWHLFKAGKYKNKLSKLIKNPYFWQDSFWTHWNRLIGCRKKHRKPHLINDNEKFCFACYRKIEL